MLLMSLTHPIKRGITAPPEIAIIIRPDISLLRVGYFSIAIENTSGQIFATASPIRKTSPRAMTGEEMSRMATKHNIPSIDVHIKSLREDILVSKIAPAKVPIIRPAK